METTEEDQVKVRSQSEQDGMTSISEDDFEVISEDDDKDIRENFEKIKTDFDRLVEEKQAITNEKEEIAQTLRKTQQFTETLNAQLDWLLEVDKCIIDTNKQNNLPSVPESLPEENRQQLTDIRDGLSQIIKRFNASDKKSEVIDATIEKAELGFYRQISQFLLQEHDDPTLRSTELPNVPDNVSQNVQTCLQRYKTVIKSMLEQQKVVITTIENDKWNGDSIAASFTKVELQGQDEVTQEVTVTMDTAKQAQSTQTTDFETERREKKEAEESARKHDFEMQMKTVTEDYQEKIHKLEQQLKVTDAEKEKALRRKEAEESASKHDFEMQMKTVTEEYQEKIHKLEQQLKVTHAEKEKALRRKEAEESASKHDFEMQMKTVTEEYQEKICKLEQQLKVTHAEKEKALRRLSAVAGDNLMANNPAIVDLNDTNRPLKIGEQFKELYDNEWTDALCTLTLQANRSDEEAIQNLLEILQAISLECQIGAQTQQTRLSDVFTAEDDKEKTSREEKHLSKEDHKKVKDFQKAMALCSLKQLEQKIMSSEAFTGPLRKEAELCGNYIRKCTLLCWLMYIQDPPMELIFEFYPGQDLDANILKEYTKNGSKINFLVWPLLLLHHDGPVVQKGIAQPY